MDENQLAVLLEEIQSLKLLLAYTIAGKLRLAEGAPILRRLGTSPILIAKVYGSTRESVSVQIAKAGKRRS